MAKIKDNDRHLKADREKTSHTKENSSGYHHISHKKHSGQRVWHDIFKAMKQKGLETSVLYLARLSFKFEGVITQFSDK